jgi:L-ribulose-5-phosphate 3-epimerase
MSMRANPTPASTPENTMQLGVFIDIDHDDPRQPFQQASELGFATCQAGCWNPARLTPEFARQVVAAAQAYQVTITALWCGWDGPAVWDFASGYATLGLVPPVFRQARLQTLLAGARFAAELGLSDLVTHAGFIPENPNHPDYLSLIPHLRYLVQGCWEYGVHFNFETGQETPLTLLRTIEDLGLPNLGVNLDPANLILYGKGNPVDALDVLGRYVRGVHAKDGRYPTHGRQLGVETPLGEGQVDFPRLIGRLKELGYDGPLTIEREISGPQQIADILQARRRLEGWLAGQAC